MPELEISEVEEVETVENVEATRRAGDQAYCFA